VKIFYVPVSLNFKSAKSAEMPEFQGVYHFHNTIQSGIQKRSRSKGFEDSLKTDKELMILQFQNGKN